MGPATAWDLCRLSCPCLQIQNLLLRMLCVFQLLSCSTWTLWTGTYGKSAVFKTSEEIPPKNGICLWHALSDIVTRYVSLPRYRKLSLSAGDMLWSKSHILSVSRPKLYLTNASQWKLCISTEARLCKMYKPVVLFCRLFSSPCRHQNVLDYISYISITSGQYVRGLFKPHESCARPRIQ